MLRKRVPHLSATALAGWSRHAAFSELQNSVEELDVMFYDLHPDAPHIGPDSPPKPLLDAQTFAKQLASWQECKIPWRAGLPNFCRVTVFDATGRSQGHIRNWNWDEVIFQPRLKFVSTPGPGLVLMKAAGDLVMTGTPIKAGSYVAVRWVDRQELVDAMNLVKKSASIGPVIFRLPDTSDPSGWSLPQLKELMTEGRVESAKLQLRKEGAYLVLKNESPADLAPHLNEDLNRGYALEVDAPIQLWREAIPGDFWRVGAHSDPEGTPISVPVPLSTRLTFWFGSLRAGKSIKSGLIQLAPDADSHQIRYRILPGDQTWKQLE